ncbi:MAG: HAMP domain-containing histidine kinase [Anaerovibrio sp.]|uniref:sensor histidine kinase n=1 Tax=Anaerovibrio sp. TaxID=1872532 RepID=UPI0025D1A902|nr:HAMP domain-containing sensor histidine kinase [Anaerovibrio sp.]MCR5176977.1 HAMP domain-containing histidine kinase [Anaerovibrio sp.]
MKDEGIDRARAVSEIQSAWLDRISCFKNPHDAVIFAGEDAAADFLFNHHMGAAFYFTYVAGILRLVKSNKAFEQEISPEISLDGVGTEGAWQFSDEQAKKSFEALLAKATEDVLPSGVGIWFRLFSQCCGFQECCISFKVSLAARYEGEILYYALVENDTDIRHSIRNISDSESKFRAAAEQANIYAWEYDVATREMRPCSRCMRDLGLPPVLENYPEPVIASGLFPPDYADMYRHWHTRVEQGEAQIQAVIPLTPERIPFHVRYTTEFDKQGRPVKAYGSATLAVDNEREVQLKEIIDSLTMKYSTVMRIDLTSGQTEVMNIGEESIAQIQAYYYDDQKFSFDEFVKKYISEYVQEDDREDMQRVLNLEAMRKSLVSVQNFSHTYRVCRKGKTWFMQVRIFRLADKNSVILAVQNVDEMMKLQIKSEDKLKLALKGIQDEVDISNALINNMADNEADITNIVMHIVNDCKDLGPDAIKRIKINMELLQDLALDIQTVSRLKQDTKEKIKRSFDLRELFRSVDSFAKSLAGIKEIEYSTETDLARVQGMEVYGNILFVKRILFNVVHNALKYSKGGSEIHCLVEAKAHGGRMTCKFKISDEGIGISPEFQPKMFEPFTQEGRQVDPWANGQGLGLYVAKQLLEKIGGSIAIYSAVDLGTIVTVNMSFDLV